MIYKPSIIVIAGIDQARKGLTKLVHEQVKDKVTLGKPLQEAGFAKSVSHEVGRRRTVGDGAACAALMAALLHYAEHKLAANASPSSPFLLNRWCEFVRARHIDLPALTHATGINEDRLDSFNAINRQIESLIQGEIVYLYVRVKPGEIRSSEPKTFPDFETRVFWSRKSEQERAIAKSLDSYFFRLRAKEKGLAVFFNGTKSVEGLAEEMGGYIRTII